MRDRESYRTFGKPDVTEGGSTSQPLRFRTAEYRRKYASVAAEKFLAKMLGLKPCKAGSYRLDCLSTAMRFACPLRAWPAAWQKSS